MTGISFQGHSDPQAVQPNQNTDSITIMQYLHKVSVLILTGTLLAGVPRHASAQSDEAAIQAARSVIKTDRHATVAQTMQFTEAEGQAFWPLYHRYRAEMDKVGDGVKKLVLEYARLYPNVPDNRAKPMLTELLALEKEQVAIRAAYLKKIGKVLPAAKSLRFAQVESRIDLAVRLELATIIPLVPVEGKWSANVAASAASVDGVPGGIAIEALQVTATVAAIDPASRKLTLVSPDGIKKTVKAGPEVINFDQIRVGDQLKVTVAEELVVQMADEAVPAETGVAAVVALAPKGAKPGGVLAETTQITAKVTAIDLQGHKVSLQFSDGTTRIVVVRKDVDLTQRKVGQEVVIRVTEALAITVEKP
jgi:hypothetical protein